MAEPQHVQAVRDDDRSAMARASDSTPFRPYVYRGGDTEPPAVTAARERHRRLNAAVARRNAALDAAIAADIMPDPEPGWEWYRELADGDMPGGTQ